MPTYCRIDIEGKEICRVDPMVIRALGCILLVPFTGNYNIDEAYRTSRADIGDLLRSM